MLSGKITKQDDWNKALAEVLNAPVLPMCVLTIISDTLSGSIGVRQGRFLVGAHTSDGTIGVPALRRLISMHQGFYSYLSAEGVNDRHYIDQGLNVDIQTLLTREAAPQPNAVTQQQVKPADEATAELRRTLQGLRPVSSARHPAVQPQGNGGAPPHAVPPMPPPPPPPPPPAPKMSGQFSQQQLADYAKQQQQQQQQPSNDEDGFSYAPQMVAPPASGKPTSALGKVVSGARNTYMKLASLSSRQKQEAEQQKAQPQQAMQNQPPVQQFGQPTQPTPWGPGVATSGAFPQAPAPGQSGAFPQAPAPGQSGAFPQAQASGQPVTPRTQGDTYGFTRPEMPPPPVSRSHQAYVPPQQQLHQHAPQHSVSQSEEPGNVVEAVRATAWRIASRVAQAAQRKSVADERVNENRKLRVVETDTAEMVATIKEKKKKWPPDPLTIMLALGVGLGVLAVGGGIFIAVQMSGNKPHMEMGKRYLSQSRPDLAITQFTLAMEKNNSDLEALELRAQAYEEQKDYEHAGADYARLAQEKPKALDAARKAAFFQYKSHKYEEAEQTCKNILQKNPDDENLKAQLVMNLARLGKFKEAVASGANLDLELVPPYLVPDFFGSLGFASWKLGDPHKAISYYSRALKADSANTDVLTDRAAAYMALKDYKKASIDFASITKHLPGKAEGYISLAKALELQKNFAGAATQLEIAVKLAPTGPLYLKLAKDHFLSGKYGPAVAECDNALQLDPRLKEAVDFRNIALAKAKSEKAIVIATIPNDVVVARRPGLRRPNVQIATNDPMTEPGRLQLEAGHFNAAITILAQAVQRTPKDATARRYYANALMGAERPREAFEQFNTLGEQGNLLPSDELTYAKAAESAGNFDRAIQLYIAILNREPTYVQSRVSLIKALVTKGYNQKASEIVAEGIKVSPDSAKLLRDALNSTPAK